MEAESPVAVMIILLVSLAVSVYMIYQQEKWK
jgi:hypothetical protein